MVLEQIDDRQVVNNEDPNFDRKLDLATAGARLFIKEHLLNRITRGNCLSHD